MSLLHLGQVICVLQPFDNQMSKVQIFPAENSDFLGKKNVASVLVWNSDWSSMYIKSVLQDFIINLF